MAKYYFFPRELAKRQPWLLGLGWRIEAAAIRGVLWLLRVLPLDRATRLAYRVLRTLGPHTQVARRVQRNLLIAFPDSSAAQRSEWTRDIFGHLGVTLAEFAQLDRIWSDRATRIEFVAAPEIELLHQRNRPAVLVTAHVSAYTLTNFVAGAFDFPLTTLYLPESNPFVRDVILNLYRALPVQMHPRDDSVRTLLSELGQGHCVGLASDVRLDAGEPLPFFGRDMPANTVPARLALRYDCELIPTRAERLPGGRYRITMYPPVRPTDGNVNAAEQARDMTAQLNRMFESWIAAAPGEWMCLGRRWPKDMDHAARSELGTTS